MVQVNRQTREEKIAMYMKCSKKELAEMLSNRDILDEVNEAFTEATETTSTSSGKSFKIKVGTLRIDRTLPKIHPE